MHELFAYLAVLAILIGFAPYIRDILRKKTKPERTTWFLWLILIVISFFSIEAQGAGWSLLLPGINVLTILVIFALSIPYGIGGFMRRDIISLVIAVLGLAGWYITQEPLVALVVAIGIDGIGAYLTMVKTYALPETETLFAWIMGMLAGFFGLFASQPEFRELIFPASIAIFNGGIVAAILLGRRRLARQKS